MEENQGYMVAATPPSLPLKRKRGRPRKDQSLEHREYACVSRKVQTWKDMERGRSQLHSTGLIAPPQENDGKDDMVGLPVSGVIDATFDAGYLLTVRIGNTRRAMRGIIFKPELYTPLSAENDVAPNVLMISRENIPFPSDIGAKGKEVLGMAVQPAQPVAMEPSHPYKSMLSPTQKTDGTANMTASTDMQAPSSRVWVVGSDDTPLPTHDSFQFVDNPTKSEQDLCNKERKSLDLVFSPSFSKKQVEINSMDAGGVIDPLSNAEVSQPIQIHEHASVIESHNDDKNGRIMELLHALQNNRNDQSGYH